MLSEVKKLQILLTLDRINQHVVRSRERVRKEDNGVLIGALSRTYDIFTETTT